MDATPACIRLPREIVDLITEDFQDDKETLSACCRISQSADTWTASCRAHIFKDVTVHVRRGRSIERFIRSLDTARFVSENIQLLCIRRDVERYAPCSIDAGVVHLLLRKLPRLRELSLQRLYCAVQQDMPAHDLGFRLTTLKYRPEQVDPTTLSAFLQILSLFAEVGELHFQPLPWAELKQRLVVPTTSLPVINSLIFEGARYPMLALTRDVLQITSLDSLGLPFQLLGTGETEFTAMLAYYGENLRELQIQLGDVPAIVPRKTWQGMQLEALTSLESVTLVISTSDSMNESRKYRGRSIMNCLAVLPSARLSEINLIFAVPEKDIRTGYKCWDNAAYGYKRWENAAYSSYARSKLSPLDKAVSQLPSLKKVYFGWTVGNVYCHKYPVIVESDICLWRAWHDTHCADIASNFPLLSEHGLLSFQ